VRRLAATDTAAIIASVSERKRDRQVPRATSSQSTIAINLAAPLAASGARVILVDAVLRRPSIADYLGREGGVGLTAALVNFQLPLTRYAESNKFITHAKPVLAVSRPEPAQIGSKLLNDDLDSTERRRS
jgi:hypothetical protein